MLFTSPLWWFFWFNIFRINLKLIVYRRENNPSTPVPIWFISNHIYIYNNFIEIWFSNIKSTFMDFKSRNKKHNNSVAFGVSWCYIQPSPLSLFICLFIWLCWAFSCGMWDLWTPICGMWDLVPWSGIRLGSSACGVRSLCHWITREFRTTVLF